MKHFCERCEQEFKPTRGKQRFCSRHCSDLAFRGSNHPRYKGGHTRPDGYRVLCIDGKRILEHRYIMEQHLGRKLNHNEVVHHIDGNPSNNMFANLQLTINQSEHVKSHCIHYRSDTHKQCSCCKEIKLRSEFTLNSKQDAYKGWDSHDGVCKHCRAKKSRDKRLQQSR